MAAAASEGESDKHEPSRGSGSREALNTSPFSSCSPSASLFSEIPHFPGATDRLVKTREPRCGLWGLWCLPTVPAGAVARSPWGRMNKADSEWARHPPSRGGVEPGAHLWAPYAVGSMVLLTLHSEVKPWRARGEPSLHLLCWKICRQKRINPIRRVRKAVSVHICVCDLQGRSRVHTRNYTRARRPAVAPAGHRLSGNWNLGVSIR